MSSGYKKIFSGLFFSTFHINLGPIEMLPAFIGWLLVAQGIGMLYEESTIISFWKAKNYTLIMVVFSLIGFIVKLTGDQYGLSTYVSYIIPVMELLFIYFLMEGIINYLQAAGEEAAASGYEAKFRVYLIFYIIDTIVVFITITTLNNGLFTIGAIAGILLVIWLMIMIRGLETIQESL